MKLSVQASGENGEAVVPVVRVFNVSSGVIRFLRDRARTEGIATAPKGSTSTALHWAIVQFAKSLGYEPESDQPSTGGPGA